MPSNLCLWAHPLLLVLASSLVAAQTPIATAPTEAAAAPDSLPARPVSDAERSSVVISATTLDLHLMPGELREEARATLTLRNAGTLPLSRIALQISSTLRWQSVAVATAAGLERIAFTQSPIATDADHTGYAQEAILTPAQPLAAGATLLVSALYAGQIRQSSQRLDVLGTAADRAAASEWDAIVPTSDTGATALRGFGDVLWYPVAAPVALLGDGNKLFQLVAEQRALNLKSLLRLRLTVEYTGDPPDAVIFDGQLRALTQTPDTETTLIAETHGLASAEFPLTPIGFRIPSLFLTAQAPVTSPNQMLTVISPHPEAVQTYGSAVAELQPLLAQWLGPTPLQPLLLLDHAGEAFRDGAFLAAALDASAAKDALTPELIGPLTQAWFAPAGHPASAATLWLEQGMAEFVSLLWTERRHGREAALAQLAQASALLALAEPDSATAPGQPLIATTVDLFLRYKAAAVLWQLRDLLTDAVLREGLLAWRHTLSLSADPGPQAFEHTLERAAKVDLGWFFTDWVDHDRGLPDLTLVQATPRLLPARPGKNAGYLVAVEVRNDGEAVADVPVIVRAVTTSTTERLRIPAHGSSSIRILFEDIPVSVQVNDGSVPELRVPIHTMEVRATP